MSELSEMVKKSEELARRSQCIEKGHGSASKKAQALESKVAKMGDMKFLHEFMQLSREPEIRHNKDIQLMIEKAYIRLDKARGEMAGTRGDILNIKLTIQQM